MSDLTAAVAKCMDTPNRQTARSEAELKKLAEKKRTEKKRG